MRRSAGSAGMMGTLSSRWTALFHRRCYYLLAAVTAGSAVFSLLVSLLLQLIVSGVESSGWGWQLLQSACTAAIAAGLTCVLLGSCRLSARVSYHWRQTVWRSLHTPPSLTSACPLRVPAAAVCLLLIPCALILLRLQFGSILASRLGSLTYSCDAGRCLDESAVLLTITTLVNSVCLAVSFFMEHGDLIQLPFVQVPRSNHLILAAVSCARQSALASWHVARYLLPCYWLLGGRLCSALAVWMAVERDGGIVAPDSLAAMLWPTRTAAGVTLYLPVMVPLTGMVVRFPSVLGRLLLPDILAAPLPAPLAPVTAPGEAPGLVLPGALGRAGPGEPLLDWLSWQEIVRVVRVSGAKQRAVLFQLSLPGDHAHTCNHLFSASLRIVAELCDSLQKTSAKAEPLENGRNGVCGPSAALSPVLTPQRRALQHWSPVLKPCVTAVSEVLVERGQPVCWALDAVTEVAAVAMHEDSFGATQQHLAPLFSALLRLSSMLEPLCRNASGLCQPALVVFRQLRHANRSSLHRLSGLYLPHLSALELDSDTVSSLTAFAHYSD